MPCHIGIEIYPQCKKCLLLWVQVIDVTIKSILFLWTSKKKIFQKKVNMVGVEHPSEKMKFKKKRSVEHFLIFLCDRYWPTLPVTERLMLEHFFSFRLSVSIIPLDTETCCQIFANFWCDKTLCNLAWLQTRKFLHSLSKFIAWSPFFVSLPHN